MITLNRSSGVVPQLGYACIAIAGRVYRRWETCVPHLGYAAMAVLWHRIMACRMCAERMWQWVRGQLLKISHSDTAIITPATMR